MGTSGRSRPDPRSGTRARPGGEAVPTPETDGLAARLARGEGEAFATLADLLHSGESERRATGWLAVVRAVETGGPGVAHLLEEAEAALREAPSDEAITLRKLLGPLLQDLRVGLGCAAGPGAVAGALERSRRGLPRSGRTIVRAAAQGLLRWTADDRNGAWDLTFESVALGTPADQRFLVDLAHAVAADTPPLAPAIRRALRTGLWTVVDTGSFALRNEAIRALGALGRLPGNGDEQTAPDSERIGTPGSRDTAAPSPGASDDAEEIRDALAAKRARRRSSVRALAGDPRAGEALIAQLDVRRRGPFVAASAIRLLPDLWQRTDADRRPALEQAAVGLLETIEERVSERADDHREMRRGIAYLCRNLCAVADRLRAIKPLAAQTDATVRRIVAAHSEILTTSLEASVDEVRIAEVAWPAAARLAATTDEPVHDPVTRRLLDGLRQVAAAPSGEPFRWRDSGLWEALCAALPDLLLAPPPSGPAPSRPDSAWPDPAWKEDLLQPILDHVRSAPPADSDDFTRYRFLVAWRTLDRLRRVVHRRVVEHQTVDALRRSARGEGLEVTDPTRWVTAEILTLDPARIARLCGPPEDVLRLAREHGADRQPPPSPLAEAAILTACALEREMLSTLGERFATWGDTAPHEQLWRVRTFWLLASGSAADLVEPLSPSRQPDRRELLFEEAVRLAGLAPDGDEPAPKHRAVIRILRKLPPAAGEALSLELPRIVETHLRADEPDQPDESVRPARGRSELGPHILALVGADSAFHVCEELARWLDRHRRRGRGTPDFDLAVALYQVVFAGPTPEVFAHLAARIDEPSERRLTELVYRHTLRLRRRSDESRSPEQRLADLVEHLRDLEIELESFDSPTLGRVRDLIHDVLRLAGPAGWSTRRADTTAPSSEATAPDISGLIALVSRIDDVSCRLGRPLGLMPSCRNELFQVKRRVKTYVGLPVARLAEREQALASSIDALVTLSERLPALQSFRRPVSALLEALLDTWIDRLKAVLEHEVRRARHMVEVGDTQSFWNEFVAGSGERSTAHDRTQLFESSSERRAFERFFARWAASRLDLPVLRDTLALRWSRPMRWLYHAVTSFWGALALLIAPYALLALGHRAGDGTLLHALRGLGFALYTLVLFATLFAVMGASALRLCLQRGPRREPAVEQHYFQCFAPRLISLIVVPMTLLVDLDYSYHFPLQGSSWMISFVLAFTLLATLFYVAREVAERPGGNRRVDPRGAVLRITGLALFEAFATAILLSTIFGSEYFTGQPDVLEHARHATFLGLIPRVVELDPSALPVLGAHLRGPTMSFQPVTLLMWTAFGLFTGIFLEGFFKRESGKE